MKLPIPAKVLDQHIVLLGKTRAGKSSTMRVLVEHLLDQGKPVCIVDPKGDWWGLKLSATGKSAGYPIVIFGGEHADVPLNPRAGAHVAELIATGNRPCLIDLKGWMVGDRTRFWIDFASTLFKLTKGMRWLVVDEVHNFAPKGKIMDPDAGKALHWSNRLASEGLGMGLHMIFASQRPQKVHNDMLTSAETLIAKRVIHPSDRDAVSDWIDGCGDPKLGAIVLNSLAQLERPDAWVWSPEIGFGPERVKFPLFGTYDSFKPQDAKVAASLKGWASVDLDEVKAKLSSVIEEAKANDPKELKAEVARLRSELQRAPKNITQNITADPKAIEAAEERGFDRAKRQLTAAAERHVREAHLNILQVLGERLTGVNSLLSDEIRKIKGTKPALSEAVTYSPAPAQRVPRPAPSVPPRSPSRANPSTPMVNAHFNRPQMRVLQSLAMWAALGHDTPSREMVAAVAGYSPSSGGYNNLLGSLGTIGAIDKPRPGHLSLAVEGIGVMSKDEGRDLLLSTLTNPQKRIVAALIDQDARSRDEVGEATGYSSSSGGYNNLLGSLSTLGIIVKPQAGYVALSDWAQELLAGCAERIAA